MSNWDRQKWEAKYADPAFAPREPSAVLVGLAPLLPAAGRAVDVAGGAGRQAIWLAQRGLQVTLVDISPCALRQAAQRAAAVNIPLTTLEADLDDPLAFPAGPWDLIVSVCFLHRPLFATLRDSLAPGGALVVIQPTRSNLQRHGKPPADFLLEDGELPTLLAGLTLVHYSEGWQADGRYDAVAVARRNIVGE